MPAYKDSHKGTWYVSFYYQDWQGKRIKKMKRGFATKKDGQNWEREFIQEKSADLSMKFSIFVKIYENDIKARIKENSWVLKENIINTKILPYFGEKKMNEIQTKDVVQWQNQLLGHTRENGNHYSPVYLKSIHNQLTAIFNHAIRYYDLRENPARKAGNMGKDKGKDIEFWTKTEFDEFSSYLVPQSPFYYSFLTLYWCGLRVGELLALTRDDFNFQDRTLVINKSYQRLKGKDVITTPKTEKSNRTVTMPEFLCKELEEFTQKSPPSHTQRLFLVSKLSLRGEMIRVCNLAGLNRIKIHSIRHSHVSLLVEMGFSAVAIADRVGHESIDITYRYAHLFPSKQQEIAQELDSLNQKNPDVR